MYLISRQTQQKIAQQVADMRTSSGLKWVCFIVIGHCNLRHRNN